MAFRYCWIKLLVLEILRFNNKVGSEDFLYQEHHVCDEYLVSGPKYRVSDEQMNASSQYNDLHAARWGRLNTVYVKANHMGGWAAAKDYKGPIYIEVRLNESSIVQAIATQGRNITGESQTNPHYVTKYHVYYKLEGEQKWNFVLGSSVNELKDFQGNNDSNSIHINKLTCAVEAIYVRILIKEWHGHPSMRFDVIGCPVSQVNISTDCDFEDGFCGWKVGNDNDSVNWKLKSGASSVPESLKLHDHTYKNGTGFFTYLNSIAASSLKKSAQLVTMIRKSNIARCLHFWSSGSYPSIGLLNISVIGCRTSGESGVSKLVTDFTQEWNHVSLDVSWLDYKLIVEGTIRGEVEGYMAIDDISLTKGECPDCNFDEGLCNWTNEDTNWMRIVHDSQRYIVINGDNESSSTTAKLLGPEVDPGNKSSCLSFSYNMSGHDNNALTVSLLLNQENSTLGMLRENSLGGWKHAFFKIENIDEKYKIRFLAFVRNGYIGLDNISLFFEPCPVITTTMAAPSIAFIIPDSITTAGTWTKQEENSSNEQSFMIQDEYFIGGGAVAGIALVTLTSLFIYKRYRRRRTEPQRDASRGDAYVNINIDMDIDMHHYSTIRNEDQDFSANVITTRSVTQETNMYDEISQI